jgi:OsmC-like protein
MERATDTSQWRLRVTATGSDDARVSMRRHQFKVGKPIDFDVESGLVSALEYALSAVAAEIVGGLRVFAKRRRIEIDHVEAVVDGHVDNALAYLEVIGESGRPRVSKVVIKVFVGSSHDDETMQRLWADTLERLPLVQTFRDALALDIQLTLTG